MTPGEHLEACLKIVDEATKEHPKFDYLSVPAWLRIAFEGKTDSRWHWHDKPKTIVYMLIDGNEKKFQLPRNPWRYDNLRIMRDAVLRADR